MTTSRCPRRHPGGATAAATGPGSPRDAATAGELAIDPATLPPPIRDELLKP